MANRITNIVNRYESVLTASMGPEALQMSVEARANAPAVPCFLVVDPLDDMKCEYIFFDGSGSTGTTFVTTTLDNRYLPGSAALGGITHDAGAVVRMSPLMQHVQDLNDRIDSRLAASQHTKSLHDALGLDHSLLSNLGSGDPHGQYLTSGRHTTVGHAWLLQVTPNGTRLHVGTEPPSSPSVGDLWVDTN